MPVLAPAPLADLPAPFVAAGAHVAVDLPGARALFTTRRGGVSDGPYASLNLGRFTDDLPDRVAENRRRAVQATGRPELRVAQGHQVHGTRVARVTQPPPREPAAEALPDADGQATQRPDVACLALAADCLPVALAGPRGVAMVHAGWRGLAGGILEAGVAALGGPALVRAAAVGPGAGPCCYEAGEEVHAALAHLGPGLRHGLRRIDLKQAAGRLLLGAGLSEVHDCRLCTICARDPDGEALFFSHRRDRGRTGRQAGLVWRLPA